MESQIASRFASPSRGAVRNLWRDWMGAAVLLLVWTTLWTVFTVGVLDPAARMSRGTSGGARHAAVAPERLSGPAVEPWVAAR